MNKSMGLALLGAWALAGQAAAVELTLACGGEPDNRVTCAHFARAWAEATGNTVVVQGASNDSSLRFENYKRILGGDGDSIDVLEIDTTSTGELADYLLDLRKVVPESAITGHDPVLIENNTVGGRLVALPWSVGVGLLYFRYDLLVRYDRRVPKTWDELADTARHVQESERERTGNEEFYGYVFTGEAYEGLTTNALEWFIAGGGENLVDADGRVTVNSPAAVRALESAAAWVGDISPTRVTAFTEESARLMFQRGDAFLMRGWPGAFRLMRDDRNSPVAGLFLAAPMPGDGKDRNHVAVLGGWQLAVNKDTAHPEEAASLVRYLTSRVIQRQRALEAGLAPTYLDLYDDREVLRANPIFAAMMPMVDKTVARPTDRVGSHYHEVSAAFSKHVNAALRGEVSARQALERAEKDLSGMKDDTWGSAR